MSERSVTHNTFVIERSYPANPRTRVCCLRVIRPRNVAGSRWKVKKSDLEQLRNGFSCGRRERKRAPRFRTKNGGFACTNDTVYLDITPRPSHCDCLHYDGHWATSVYLCRPQATVEKALTRRKRD